MSRARQKVFCAFAVIFLSVAACSDAHWRLTGPSTATSALLTRTAALLSETGCMVASDLNGLQRQAALSKRELTPSIPRSDQARPNRSGYTLLRVVTTEFRAKLDGGRVHTIGVACLVPSGVSGEHLLWAVRRDGGRFSAAIAATLAQATVSHGDTRSVTERAAAALREPFLAGATPKRVRRRPLPELRPPQGAFFTGQARRAVHRDVSDSRPSVTASRLEKILVEAGVVAALAVTGIQAPSFIPALVVEMTVHGLRGTGARPSLPNENLVTVYIWNSGTTIFVDNSLLIDWLKRLFGADGLEFADYVDCTEVTGELQALDGQIAELEADSLEFANAEYAINTFAPASCVPQGNSKKICIDGHIKEKLTGLGFLGDGRGTDPSAPYIASRFQAYWDPDGNSATLYISSSSSALLGAFGVVTNVGLTPWSFAPPDTIESGAFVYRENDSTAVIELRAYDGYCNYFPTELFGTDFVCPAADYSLRMTKRNGEWIIKNAAMDVRGDGYPTVDVFKEDASQDFQLLRHDEQGYLWRLWQRHKSIQDTRYKRLSEHPEEC